MLERLKGVARQRPWVPDHGTVLLGRSRKDALSFSDFDHVRAAARWLAVAQDSQSDGGISGRYRLDRGWTSSYPETTGYLIPTLLALDKMLPGSGFATRAARAVDFLLRVQLKSGGFPGMEIADNATEPSPFNTAQILNGLTAWHQATGDERAHSSAERAAGWLKSIQDEDGAFRKHTYLGLETTYTAHASCWLAEWGAHARDEEALAAAERHLDWVLRQVQPNGWIAHMGFGKEQHAADEAFTHTIAYTLAGILTTSLLLQREDGIAVARRGAQALLELCERERRLPGVIGNWQGKSDSVCLTGNAQVALLWFRLHRHATNLRFVNGALKVLDHIKATQQMSGRNAGILGGVAGSSPIGGPYIPNALPNWAAKFFIDALLEKQTTLRELAKAPPPQAEAIASLDVVPAPAENRARLSTVILTRAGSRRAPELLKALGDMPWGALTVLAVRENRAGPLKQIEAQLDRIARLTSGTKTNGGLPAFCRARGIALLETGALDKHEALAVLKKLAPDLGIAAEAPALGNEVLACFRLGVLHATKGLLPLYRGANAAEWAALERGWAGCSVHVMDGGTDTGPILARRALDIFDCRGVAVLRNMVDTARHALLAEVVRTTLDRGALPAAHTPPEADAPAVYRMHHELVAVLNRKLESQVWN